MHFHAKKEFKLLVIKFVQVENWDGFLYVKEKMMNVSNIVMHFNLSQYDLKYC